MGRFARQISDSTTRYYWYPGDRIEWSRAAAAISLGVLAFLFVGLLSKHPLAAVVTGTSVTALLTGVNFGRREARAVAGFPDAVQRRTLLAHTGRCVWRALVLSVGGATFAALIANMPGSGLIADWLLPMVPVVLGALGHHGGMLYERLADATPVKPRPVPSAVPVAVEFR